MSLTVDPIVINQMIALSGIRTDETVLVPNPHDGLIEKLREHNAKITTVGSTVYDGIPNYDENIIDFASHYDAKFNHLIMIPPYLSNMDLVYFNECLCLAKRLTVLYSASSYEKQDAKAVSTRKLIEAHNFQIEPVSNKIVRNNGKPFRTMIIYGKV